MTVRDISIDMNKKNVKQECESEVEVGEEEQE